MNTQRFEEFKRNLFRAVEEVIYKHQDEFDELVSEDDLSAALEFVELHIDHLPIEG